MSNELRDKNQAKRFEEFCVNNEQFMEMIRERLRKSISDICDFYNCDENEEERLRVFGVSGMREENAIHENAFRRMAQEIRDAIVSESTLKTDYAPLRALKAAFIELHEIPWFCQGGEFDSPKNNFLDKATEIYSALDIVHHYYTSRKERK